MTAPDRVSLAGPTFGTVDLVAIDRVRHGIPAELTEADLEYLIANLGGGNEEARLIGQALGVDERQVQRLRERRNRSLSPP